MENTVWLDIDYPAHLLVEICSLIKAHPQEAGVPFVQAYPEIINLRNKLNSDSAIRGLALQLQLEAV